MNTISALNNINFFKTQTDIKALDIGAGNSYVANFLVNLGSEVTAIDRKQLSDFEELSSSVKFQEVDFFDFTTADSFNLIVANNVFPVLDRTVDFFEACNIYGDQNVTVCFSILGQNDDWYNCSRPKHTEIKELLSQYRFVERYHSEESFDGKDLNGNVKKWHLYFWIVTKKCF